MTIIIIISYSTWRIISLAMIMMCGSDDDDDDDQQWERKPAALTRDSIFLV